MDPAARSSAQIIELLEHLPQSFPFRGTIIGAVPKPVRKVGFLELDPVSPMKFGFDWGVDPVFKLGSVGPPIEFKVGGEVNARYGLKLIDKPGSTVPQLGLFVQGDFRGTIDWTSQAARRDRRSTSKGRSWAASKVASRGIIRSPTRLRRVIPRAITSRRAA